MKKSAKHRLEALVTKLRYQHIQLSEININQLVPWMRKNMPKVVEQLEPLGWDLSCDDTWLETMFISRVIKWYGKNIAVFITESYTDYKLSEELLSSPIMQDFWSKFNIASHTSVLVDSTMFIEEEALDDIYINLSFDKKQPYSLLDLSGYDENDDLLPHLQDRWDFLTYEYTDEGYVPWTDMNHIQISIQDK
jgi:hypothetical protein